MFCEPSIGSCLLFVNTEMTWPEARNHCQSAKMDLAAIESLAEANFAADVTNHITGMVQGDDKEHKFSFSFKNI